MKLLPIIALTLSLLAPSCVPLVLGGAVGYAVYEHEQSDKAHQKWMAHERAKLDRMRWQVDVERGYLSQTDYDDLVKGQQEIWWEGMQ